MTRYIVVPFVPCHIVFLIFPIRVFFLSMAKCGVFLFHFFFFFYVKVPSFPDDVAMALIEEELGKPWHEVYSELSPSPIAAGKF